MLVPWSVQGTVSDERLSLVRSFCETTPSPSGLPAPLPSGWEGMVLHLGDHWLVPIDETLFADRGVCTDLWEDLRRTISRSSHPGSVWLTGAIEPLGADPRRAVLLEPPQSLGFAIHKKDLPVVAERAVAGDPWWPGLIALAESDRLVAGASNSLQSTARRLPELAPDRPRAARNWLSRHLRNAALDAFLPKEHSSVEETAIRAGLLIWHDFLDEGHHLAQSIEGAAPGRGDHWHAIMHRREPDYPNAKYWFRRINRPAWFADLAQYTLDSAPRPAAEPWAHWVRRLVGPNGWDPLAFVDFCEACRVEDLKIEWFAQQVQRAEMEHLLMDRGPKERS